MLQPIDQRARDEVLAAVARCHRARHIPAFDAAQNVFDDFGLTPRFFTDEKQQAFQHHGQRDKRRAKQRPHERAAFLKNLKHNYFICAPNLFPE